MWTMTLAARGGDVALEALNEAIHTVHKRNEDAADNTPHMGQDTIDLTRRSKTDMLHVHPRIWKHRQVYCVLSSQGPEDTTQC